MAELKVLKINYDMKSPSRKGMIYPIILKDEENLCLIDCGFIGSLSQLKKEVEKHKINFDEINKVIITHHDHDHMGTLADIKELYPNINVISSEIEKDYISGKKKSLRLEQVEKNYEYLPESEKPKLEALQKILKTLKPAAVDKTVQDKEIMDICGGIEFVMSPGHLPGHMSVYLRESKTLIAGDALSAEENKLCLPNPIFTLDMETAKKTISKFVNYDIEKIVCYHGGVIDKDIKNALQSLI